MAHLVEGQKWRWDLILDFMKEYGFRRIAEIGVYRGENASKILEATNSKSFEHFFLIDKGISGDFRKWLFESGRIRVNYIKGLSVQSAQIFNDGYFDLIFIDADHRYEHVKQDIESWLPKIRKGGILAGHDYLHPKEGTSSCGVKQAVDEIFGDEIYIQAEPRKVHNWWYFVK